MNPDPSFWGVLLVLLAANSGLWRIMDQYIKRHEGCGMAKCRNTLVNFEFKKDTTKDRN